MFKKIVLIILLSTLLKAQQPVTVVSSSLPTGSATEATLSTLNGKVVAVNTGAVVVSVLPPVTATDLDIRNLVFATDKIDISGSSSVGVTGPLTDTQLRALPVPVSGTITVNEPVTVDAIDLDIRNLTFAGDKVDISSSTSVGVTGTFFQATQPVSGTFFQATQPISAVSLPLPTGAATSALQTQPGVDIGDVTINNAGAGAAVNIQDGGNSITVDGTVTTSPPANASTNISQWNGVAPTAATALNDLFMNPTAPPVGSFLMGWEPLSVQWERLQTYPGTGGLKTLNYDIFGNPIAKTDGSGGFTQETNSVVPSGFIFDDTVGTALAENDIAAARITAARALVIRVEGVTRGTYATLTGTSQDVNCTGGCGTPTQGQTYFATAVRGASVAAVKDYLNLFNAVGSGKVLKIISIKASSDNTSAIGGLGWTAELDVTSTVGTTCTAITIRLADSNNTAVPAQVTSSHTCTTDPVVTFEWAACQLSTDEAAVLRGPSECYRFENSSGQPMTLREGQGIMIRTSNAVAPVGLITVTIEFTM